LEEFLKRASPLHRADAYSMKATIFVTTVLASLALPLSAQVLHDPQAPESRGPVDAARGNAGKLATRDQHGTYKMKDGILKARGSVQFLKNGKMNIVNSEMKLSEGFVVRPNGQITKPDGSTVTLEEGQMLTLDGRMTQAPASTGSTAPDTKDPLPPRTGNLTDYGQSGVTGPGGEKRQPAK
jgi:hypothetical protein